MNLKIILLIIFTNFFLASYSQGPPSKFGKISIEEMKTEICPIDSIAHAYFIFDYGESYFKYADSKVSSDDMESSMKGFQLYFTRHFRLKIIDNQGFSWSNVQIPLYRDGDQEKIQSIKASTYNLENNKIIETKLDKKDVFTEETSKFWITEKFAMPAVREGSIIEIEYTIKSDFYFNLRQWYFQWTIPVMQSEYHVNIPEYYNFNQTQKGYFPIKIENETRPNKITLTYHQKAEGMAVNEGIYTQTIDFREDVFHYYAKEIPAFHVEEYLRTKENYLSKYEFELSFVKFPYSDLRLFTTSWEQINKDLLDDYQFGKELDKTSHLKEDVEALIKQGLKDDELIKSAFNLIRNKLTWNGYSSKYVTTTLAKAYKDGVGNSADINLNLVVLLGELGFEVYPVILSTQENGIIHPAHPSITRFNYVIALVKLENDTLLLDATDPNSGINLLPIRCLNDEGRIVNQTNGDWVNLMNHKLYSKVEMFELEFDSLLEIHGKQQVKMMDYAAYNFKDEIKKYNSIEDYKVSLEKQTQDFNIQEFKMVGLDNHQDDIKLSINFSLKNFAEQTNEITFFTPVFQPFIIENPFKLEKRDYPVEFNHGISLQQIYSIRIPEGYFVSEMPKPVKAVTPDGKLKYYYNINQEGDKLMLSIVFSISKTLFLPDEYEGLQDFYQLIIDKQNELVVIKKAQ